jgi:hypothetical protein
MALAYESENLRLEGWRQADVTRTHEDEVLVAVGIELQSGLANYVAQPDFDAALVPDALKDHLDAAGPGTLRGPLRREVEYGEYGSKPLTRHFRQVLGRTALEPQELLTEYDVVLGPRTIFSLQQQVDALPYDFTELAGYHRTWRQNGAFDLLANVHRLSAEAETNPMWADAAYDLISDASSDPEAYTLPLDQPESLMLLCYAPHDSRQLLRRFARNNLVLGLTERDLAIAPDAHEADTELLSALRRYYRADVLQGGQWDDRPLSEPYRVATAMASVDAIAALADIQRITQAGGGSAAIAAFHAAESRIWEALQRTADATQLAAWQGTDYGHAFSTFGYMSLGLLLDPKTSRTQEFAHPEKDGSLAAVLEDDADQMKVWRQTVDARTRHAVRDDFCSADVEQIVGLAEHAPGSEQFVSLFLLDIENDGDRTAGIRAAEAIIAKRLQQAQALLDDGAEVPQTKVVIWSASPEAVKTAVTRFKEFTRQVKDEYPDAFPLWSINGNGWGGSAVACDVRLKGWKETDTPLEHIGDW